MTAWYFLVPAIVLGLLFTGSVAFGFAHRKVSATCSHSSHFDCGHTGFTVFTCYFWPVAIPLWAVALSVAGLVQLGLHVGRTPSQRRDLREKTQKAVADYRKAQEEAAEWELERQLYGDQTCRYCQTKIERKNSSWRSTRDGSNGCYDNPGRYGGGHAPPDALDAKLDQAEKEKT